jgi:co-chaperonin GroES (HSP10)
VSKLEFDDVKNTSGLRPIEFKVLVKPDKVEKSRGRIVIPERVQDKELRENCEGTLIAVGGIAFTEPDIGEPRPQLGDRVVFAPGYGRFRKGADDEYYILMNDKDIAGILDAEPKEKELHDSDQPDHAGDGQYDHLRSK